MSELRGRVVILSPHLDDAVFSLGAGIAQARDRAEVEIVTVFAGDPASAEPAGPWDREGGFGSAGEASAARREEDRAACARIEATPHWLSFPDEQYARGADDDRIWEALEPLLRGADAVLVPGTPLVHDDHLSLTRLVLARDVPAGRLGLYVEQPYAAIVRRTPARDPWTDRQQLPVRWAPLTADDAARRAKREAVRTYRSQLGLMHARWGVLRRVRRYESARGGESVGWISRTNR
jgi:LmbE family N-acetylglucosaminyl deacetylase